jgi:G3E family GTPase
MVRKELPASVYRCKGIVFATDCLDKRFALQAVGRRTETSELDEWGERTPRTKIVAIGASIDAQKLTEMFDACVAPS